MDRLQKAVLGLTVAFEAIKFVAEKIGEVEWKGRFRRRVNAFLEAQAEVDEKQQIAIEELAKAQQEIIDELTELREKLEAS